MSINKVKQMEKFDKAKIVLRKYILANKDKVEKDLEEMRKKSTGKDINWYLKKLSGE
jgi:deoxyribodipyrimidine photolyase